MKSYGQVTKEQYLAKLEQCQIFSKLIMDNTTPWHELAEKPGKASYYLFWINRDSIAGFSITDSGELQGLFSTCKGAGYSLVSMAIEYGANRLDCFDGYLPGLYSRHGFKEYKREKNWIAGQPDVVYMSLYSSHM